MPVKTVGASNQISSGAITHSQTHVSLSGHLIFILVFSCCIQVRYS